jgi:DNA ligase (NAD+)
MHLEEDEHGSSQKLQGLSFVISGTYEGYSRDEVKSLIEQHGGKNTSSISAKTNYLIAGANAGPSKIDKATKVGIKILKLQEFLNLIE